MSEKEQRSVMDELWCGQFEAAESRLRPLMQKAKSPGSVQMRLALVDMMRFVFVADRRFAKTAGDAFYKAEMLLEEEADRVAGDLQDALSEHNDSQNGFLKRMSRRASNAAPILSKIGLTSAMNPGELLASRVVDKKQKQSLQRWKNLRGKLALCAVFRTLCVWSRSSGYLSGLMSLRKAWQTTLKASDNIESVNDKPNLIHLVQGFFLVTLSNVPPFLARILRAVGFRSSKKEGLEKLKACVNNDEVFEEAVLAKTVLCIHYLMVSAQEYNTNRVKHLRDAESTVDAVLARHPRWLIFRLIASHVHRRLGKTTEALKTVQSMIPDLDRELQKVRLDPPLQRSFRLDFDTGILAFIKRDFKTATKILEPIVLTELDFNAKFLAAALVAACYGAEGPMRDDAKCVYWLDCFLDLEVNGNVDKSFLFKHNTLSFRPHKSLMQHELCYQFGYMKQNDVLVASSRSGGSKEASSWLQLAVSHLDRLTIENETLVVYPEFPATPISATEELLAAALLSGAALSLQGEYEEAERRLKFVLSNSETSHAKMIEDKYHVGYALYELGGLEIKRENFQKAKEYLLSAKKKARHKNFSFAWMLAFKVNGALKFLETEKMGVEEDDFERRRVDELGAYDGNDGASMLGMTAVEVSAGKKQELSVVVKKGDEVGWNLLLESHDIGYQVKFNKEEIEPYELLEAGDIKEGFHSSVRVGKLKILLDNSHSKFTAKRVLYSWTGVDDKKINVNPYT